MFLQSHKVLSTCSFFLWCLFLLHVGYQDITMSMDDVKCTESASNDMVTRSDTAAVVPPGTAQILQKSINIMHQKKAFL